ncbi:hypothetical protein [Stenotrophomonas oahuensis]|uniref:Uncharacterized protein n=1 Tax=Stenotrophomonas oahuensis TaxID=3003271 RepID=A0ABY9YNY5_9GAMM|nr:hypothetical protein [Stenotrophomonas sp. A5586]WNH52447.1 hypothetical protein PDM29_19345 [Stenotrophomonas sp. A5586]
MSIRTAIRNLKAELPAIKEHLSESKAGINELAFDLYDDVADLERELYVARVRAKEILKEEKAFNRAVTRNYVMPHIKALAKGAWADLKIGAYYAWCLPFSLVVWLAFILVGVAVTGATFSLRKGGETVERLIDAL